MTILQIHNYYQLSGGEDVVVEHERALLERNGHEVIQFLGHNDDLKNRNMVFAAVETIWSHAISRQLDHVLENRRFDIAHIHNTFLRISPAIYYALNRKQVPIVQTLHNYRLVCLNGTLFRAGHVCEECLVSASSLPGVIHRCYRDSLAQSAVVGATLSLHRFMKTWEKNVDAYIALTKFSRNMFIRAGFAPEKVLVKPNFLSERIEPCTARSGYAIYVGRLAKEKGIQTLLWAWNALPDIPLKIIGDGPLREWVSNQTAAHRMNHVEILGSLPIHKVIAYMQRAYCLIFPSEWYETFGRVLIEAFACGLPVIASRLAAATEVLENERTGLFFSPGNSADLTAKVQWAWRHPVEMDEMGRNARREYELKYTPERNYEMLMSIYEQAIANHRNGSQAGRG